MENKKENQLPVEIKTLEDIKRENQELGKLVTEDKKSEYQFNGEYLYFVGVGHAWLDGFFNTYITKSGIKAIQFYEDKWSIDNIEYAYDNGKFVQVQSTQVSDIPIDWDSIPFPTVKNVSATTIADKLISVKPKDKP